MSSLSNINNFLNNFNNYGEKTAIAWENNSYSYSHLLKRITHWRTELKEIPGDSIVALQSDFSPETIAILFVLIEKKVTVVPLDINHAKKNEIKLELAQVDVLISILSEREIEVKFLNIDAQSKNSLYVKNLESGVPGLVLFTSGSSGTPKGAVHNFSKLLDKFQVKRDALLTINFLLFDHWGGLNTLFHILSNGGTVIALENRSPDYVCKLIEDHKVELLPTSPTFLNMLVLSRAYERFSLKSLKIISYGAEPMPESLLKIINNLFPKVKLQQTYGLIELGVMRSKSKNNESLWVKIGGKGFETRVVDNMLQIKSDSAMLGYLNAPSPFTKDGWFMTGDSVEVEGEYFKILGRKSEQINVGGEKVFPQEVENVILELPFIEDVMIFGEENNITGKIVCAKVKCISDMEKSKVIKEVRIHCRKKLESFKVPIKIYISEESFTSQRFKKNRVGKG